MRSAILLLALAFILLTLSRGGPAAATSFDNIYTVAGGGWGEGGPATAAPFLNTAGVAIGTAGEVYVADWELCRVRKIVGSTITVVAGNGFCGYSGDGGPATSGALDRPYDVAIGPTGDLYIADWNNCRVRKVTSGTITTFAGNGACSFGGDGGAATSAMLLQPRGLATSASGDVYIADTYNHRIRKVSGGVISTVAGNGNSGYTGDGVAATNSSLNYPDGVAISSSGDLYVADRQNCRIRKVTAGVISTFAGNGACIYFGDGMPASNASLNQPQKGALRRAGTFTSRIQAIVGSGRSQAAL